MEAILAVADPASDRRVAAVTGGLGGIGAGVVATLAQRGFDIVVCDRTIDAATAAALAARAPTGVHLSFVAGDLADLGDHPRFNAIATLAGGDVPFMTGAAIPIDGGMHIHQY